MRKHLNHLVSLIALSIMAVLAATAFGASAAAPVDIEHFGPATDSNPQDDLCGVPGASTSRFVGNLKVYADGTFLSTGNFDEAFTAQATGKAVFVSGVEQVTGPFTPTNSGNGTMTQTFVFKGLPMKVSIANGPTLVRDAGNATVAITFAVEPDGSRGPVLSQTVLIQHGPHPQLDSDPVFCNTVVAALS
jgi:hypothetical protein